jgi:WhiB family transcriptional regulator, redox-sensing transcriptional regulator
VVKRGQHKVSMATINGDALLDQNWRALASCSQIDPDLFFAVGAREHKMAKKVCRSCPVRRECLAYAMDEPVDHGIWGGMTERERRRYRRQAGTAGWRSLLGA